MRIFRSIVLFWRLCRRAGHAWQYDGETLGGVWIRCSACGRVDEYLPGLHEPEGGEAVWQGQLSA